MYQFSKNIISHENKQKDQIKCISHINKYTMYKAREMYLRCPLEYTLSEITMNHETELSISNTDPTESCITIRNLQTLFRLILF